MNVTHLENPQQGVMCYCFIQGAVQKMDFCPGQRLLSVFARTTAFAFCAALFCKIQAEESQPRLQRKNLPFLFHHSKQINSKTCVCIRYIVTGSKIKNFIFSYCNISFSTNSVSNLILKACAFDPLKARNLHFAVEL